nr:chemotaxis protein CheW [Methylobacterium gnaphalii]
MSQTTTYLILDVAGTSCALPRDAVREVLPLPHLHAPPAAGGPIAGFLNLGGVPLPVLDLARLLGQRAAAVEPDPYRHILLAADGSLALLVDRVVDAVQVSLDAVRSVSDTRTLNGCVEAEIALDKRFVHVLSMQRILTTEERERVATLSRRAAERLASFDAAVMD